MKTRPPVSLFNPRRTVPLLVAVGQSIVCAEFSFSAEYTYAKLQLPATWIFYDARSLDATGRSGGYVRISNNENPVDVPVTWDDKGFLSVLPVQGIYRQAYVLGFRPDGTPVGLRRTPDLFPGPAGFWTDSDFVGLPDFGEGGAAKSGNTDTIVGETYVLEPNQTFTSRATIWTSAGPTRVTGIGDFASRADDINDAGIYVGPTQVPDGVGGLRNGGFVGRDGTGEVVTFPGIQVRRTSDVNNSNRIVGEWTPDGTTIRGFVATAFEDDFQDLGLFPGLPGVAPTAINDHGVIVGGAVTNTGVRALIWHPGEAQPTDFNTLVDIPGETLVEAIEINNAGQVLARGLNGYYIFTPIPEPASLGAIALTAYMLRRVRRETQSS